ncbi:hypothetical protein [uncultured Modestobacter sp.]|nr:hypothetical protein [uncultured Modestobacter sp.]
MTHAPDDNGRPSGLGRMPKNRARLLIVSVFVLMIVVAFGFMILVGQPD